MKYLALGPRLRIRRIYETATAEEIEENNLVEVTDEVATEAEALREAGEIPLFYNGNVTTRAAEVEGGDYSFQWSAEEGNFVKEQVLTASGMPASQARAAYAATGAVFDAMDPGKRALWEPVRAQVAAALQVGDATLAKSIVSTVPLLYDGMEDDRNAFLALFPTEE